MGSGASSASWTTTAHHSVTGLLSSGKRTSEIAKGLGEFRLVAFNHPEKVDSHVLLSEETGLLDWLAQAIITQHAEGENKLVATLITRAANLLAPNVVNYVDETCSLDYMCSDKCRLLPAIYSIYSTMSDTNKKDVAFLCHITAKYGHSKNSDYLVKVGFHTLFLNNLINFTSSTTANTYSLDAVMSISRHQTTVPALIAANVKTIISPIINNKDRVHGLKALFTMIFISGKEESTEANKFMSLRPDAMHMMFEALRIIVTLDHAPDYYNGTFSLRLVVNAFLYIATSDAKRDSLVALPEVLTHLKMALDLFVDDKPEIRCPKPYEGECHCKETVQSTVCISAQI